MKQSHSFHHMMLLDGEGIIHLINIILTCTIQLVQSPLITLIRVFSQFCQVDHL